MRSSSCKAKGRKFQQYVRDKILEYFPSLTVDDVRSTSMGASGTDIQLSAEAKRQFPYAVEAKNTEKLSIWSAIQQAEMNSGSCIPLVAFTRNRSKSYVVIELDVFMEMAAKNGPVDVFLRENSDLMTSLTKGPTNKKD